MWNLQKLFDRLTAKRYEGVVNGNLPTKTTAWGKADYLRANEISLYTNRALAKRAEKVGEIQFALYDAKGNEIENDETLNLLYKPNALMDGYKFWSLYQKYLDIFGEVYIFLSQAERSFGDRPTIEGMHLLRPDYVTPEFATNGAPVKFIYKTGSGTVDYLPKQIIYIYNPDPSMPLRGMSLLKAGITSIQTETQIATYHSRILDNGGKVEGVFKFKTSNLTEEQLKGLKDRYVKEYATAQKAGMPLFLGGDSEYIKTGLTPNELSYLEAKKMTLEDICILTGVPKAILSSFDDIQYSNADTSVRVFLRETVRPLLQALTTALDERLYPQNMHLTFVDPTPENVEEKLKETESGIKSYYMTINEARERHGLDPVANGDVIMVPFNVMPMGSEKPTAPAKQLSKSEDAKHPNQDPEVRAMWGKLQVKRMDAREASFANVLTNYFDDQKTRLVEALQPTKTRVFRKENVIDELLRIDLEVKIGKEMFIPVLRQLLQDAGQDAMEFAGSEYPFNLNADIASWIDKKADVFLTTINETTLKQLQATFAEALANGENREQLISRIQDTYGDINKLRAATIARTEVHGATQEGTAQGYKQAGLQIKIWASVLDLHTRETHAGLDGEEKPLDMAFSNGLMYPGDPRGSAEEVINCRCTI